MATETPPPAQNDAEPAITSARALVRGHVQGVYFRSSAAHEARVRGVCGWVRNLPGGDVELVAEGPREAVEALLAWCWHGPPAARVTAVEVTPREPTREWTDFEVRRGS